MTKEQIEQQMWDNYDEGYKAGRSETINKACEWLADNLLYYWGQINANDTNEFIDNFKKAMEQQ